MVNIIETIKRFNRNFSSVFSKILEYTDLYMFNCLHKILEEKKKQKNALRTDRLVVKLTVDLKWHQVNFLDLLYCDHLGSLVRDVGI